MFPAGSLITFVNSGASSLLYADRVEREFLTEKFDRLEYSNAKLREAPTASGAKPIIVTTFGNKPIQLASTCTGDAARPLGPDDSNISNIKKRFNTTRYTITGSASLASSVDAVNTIYQTHAGYLDRFDLHLEKAQMELSYGALVNLQSQNFSFLLSTGLSAVGVSIGGTLSDAIIVKYSSSPEFLITSSGAIAKTWSMTLDIRTVTARE